MLKRRLLASVTVLTLALAGPTSALAGGSAAGDQYQDPFKSQTRTKKKKKSAPCPKRKRNESRAQKRKRTKCVTAKRRAAKRRSGGR